MIVNIILILLVSSTVSRVILNDVEPNSVVTVRFSSELNVTSARTVISELLDVPSSSVQITDLVADNDVISFVVRKNVTAYFGADEVASQLASSPLFEVISPIVAPQHEATTSAPSENFWESSWFVVGAAVCVGLVVFLVMAPPIYCCMKKRKNSELAKLDNLSAKRYDAMGRDGSIQSRRKLAPSTLTLTALTQPSTDTSSDSDTSPPGVKEALQSRTNPLTPLQLRQRLDNPALLYSEFSSMPANEETRSMKKSSLKNRYKGVLPNVHSRVKLKLGTTEVESYINANFVKGYKGIPRVYIATQGPLKNTVQDFWQMIWQENVNTIVMITRLQEKGRNKCVIYWPDHVGTYDRFTVTVRDSTNYEGFTVTSMLITDGVEVHRLCHLWMWSWPDQGVPDSSRSLLALLSCVHSVWQTGSSPLVVHCSAGLGRTGCFIAVDIGIQALKHERAVDVLKIVASMRLDRGGMVQTLEQYEFVHRALLRHEVSTRNKHRFKGLRKASFSHEGPPEALYGIPGSRRMSCSSSNPYISHAVDNASTSLPTYISPLLSADHPELPSPDSPKPPSLLQLSQLMEKSSKRKISQLRRTTAVDFSIEVDHIEPSPPKPPVKEESSPDQFLKTPAALTKSSFSLDLGRLDNTKRLPRSASEDTPDHNTPSSPRDLYSSKSINMSCFTFDFEAVTEPESPVLNSTFRRQSSLDSPILINS